MSSDFSKSWKGLHHYFRYSSRLDSRPYRKWNLLLSRITADFYADFCTPLFTPLFWSETAFPLFLYNPLWVDLRGVEPINESFKPFVYTYLQKVPKQLTPLWHQILRLFHYNISFRLSWKLKVSSAWQIGIEQNRCAMVCQGCGAAFSFSQKQ